MGPGSGESGLRIVFAGTAPFAVPTLERLVEAGHDVRLVLSQPDRPAGRGLKPAGSPVKAAATALGLRLTQPDRIRDQSAVTEIAAVAPDLFVVVAYGQIIPGSLLSLPRLGAINLHASLLPRHRGPAPIEWAILAGDAETGVTVMQMDQGVDTGPILTQARTPIAAGETATSLESRLADEGARLMVATIGGLQRGDLKPAPQPSEGATHAPRLRSEDGKLKPEMSALEIDRRVRALGERLGVWWSHPAGPVKILRGHLDGDVAVGVAVKTSEGTYVIDEVQPPGGRRMSAAAWIRGRR
jgi:methionyl-tRNA formyltransferase